LLEVERAAEGLFRGRRLVAGHLQHSLHRVGVVDERNRREYPPREGTPAVVGGAVVCRPEAASRGGRTAPQLSPGDNSPRTPFSAASLW
jgi:hypothetical protein